MLSTKDIALLIEALNVWEKQPVSDSFMPMLLGSIMKKENPEEAEKFMYEEREKSSREVEERSEKKIILQAKLLQMRDESILDEAKSLAK